MRHQLHSIFLAGLLLAFAGRAHGSNPTGTLAAINPATGIATGQASDADRAGQPILVDFWIGTGFTTYVGETSTQASDGTFTFQIPAQYRDGVSRQFCAWAINQAEPHVMIGCKTFAQAATLPTGTLASIDANGLATGIAADADRPGQSILVDFWIGTGFTTYVGVTSTQASNGAYAFQIPVQYRDGLARSFCAWGINQVQPHVMLGCKTYQSAVDHAPTGSLSSVNSNAIAVGTAQDPDQPSQPVQVKFYRGSTLLGTTTTSGGNFTFTIPSSKRVSGTVCADVVQGTTSTPIGCKTYVKPALAYFGYFTSSTPFRLGMGDHTDDVTDHANLAWVESNDCYVISSSEDRSYCDVPSSPTVDRSAYLETLPGSGRTIDFFDLMSRVEKAKSVGDKAMVHLQQFLFAASATSPCFYLRTDSDAVIQAVSRQLYAHQLMDTVVGVYPFDEPYLNAIDPDGPGPSQGLCHSAANQTPFATSAERIAAMKPLLESILVSIRNVDAQSGAARFPEKATTLILSYAELGWPEVEIPADYDWIGYDGYIATGEHTQDYNYYLGLLKAKIAVLPNASAKRILLVPEAYVPLNEVDYSPSSIASQCSSEVAPSSSFIPDDDGHRQPECILLSNFLKAYRLALCDPTIVAMVPFIWQYGMDYVSSGGSDSYRELTSYLVTATLVGQGIGSGTYALPIGSCPAQ